MKWRMSHGEIDGISWPILDPRKFNSMDAAIDAAERIADGASLPWEKMLQRQLYAELDGKQYLVYPVER